VRPRLEIGGGGGAGGGWGGAGGCGGGPLGPRGATPDPRGAPRGAPRGGQKRSKITMSKFGQPDVKILIVEDFLESNFDCFSDRFIVQLFELKFIIVARIFLYGFFYI
jgi:hypothetical protein